MSFGLGSSRSPPARSPAVQRIPGLDLFPTPTLTPKHVQPQHAAASNFLSSCVCLPAPALFARETFCLPHVSPVCFYLSCHESVICTNNIQSTVNTKHTTFPIRWENSAGEWERQPGNVPRREPAEPECSQKRRFSYAE